MKVVVVGSEGTLGSELCEQLQRFNHEITRMDLPSFNICNLKDSKYLINNLKPDVIINSAAYSDVDSCEINKDRAVSINIGGTKNLALICKEIGIHFIHISSDYVFDGTLNRPYDEWSIPNPVNVYGQTKQKAEEYVRKIIENHSIVRTSFLFGTKKNNHLKKAIDLLSSKARITAYDDQVMCPTYTKDVAHMINILIKNKLYGTYHAVNRGFCSRYEFLITVKKLLGGEFNKNEIVPVKLNDVKNKAQRPLFTALNLSGIFDDNKFQFNRFWNDSLEEVIGIIM